MSALRIQKIRITAPTSNVFDFSSLRTVSGLSEAVGGTVTPEGTGDGARPTGMSDIELIRASA